MIFIEMLIVLARLSVYMAERREASSPEDFHSRDSSSRPQRVHSIHLLSTTRDSERHDAQTNTIYHQAQALPPVQHQHHLDSACLARPTTSSITRFQQTPSAPVPPLPQTSVSKTHRCHTKPPSPSQRHTPPSLPTIRRLHSKLP